MLTEEQYKALPCLRPDARIKLIGIHQHRALTGNPYTVEAPEGHFRVPRVLVPLVKKSIDWISCYDGPDEGAVNELLRQITESKPSGDLTIAIDTLLDDASAELRARVLEAARARTVDRAALVTEAAKIIAGL